MEKAAVIQAVHVFRGFCHHSRGVVDVKQEFPLTVSKVGNERCPCRGCIADNYPADVHAYLFHAVKYIFTKVIVAYAGDNTCAVIQPRCGTGKDARRPAGKRPSEVFTGFIQLHIFLRTHNFNQKLAHNHNLCHSVPSRSKFIIVSTSESVIYYTLFSLFILQKDPQTGKFCSLPDHDLSTGAPVSRPVG